MKDNFSIQSSDYATYRPTYPKALYDYIFSFIKHTNSAWDCGTGNGQVAQELAKRFTNVQATDISENQLKNALNMPNITYQLAAAEEPIFREGQFDLITVAQAIHWFNFESFYQQAKVTLKPGGVLAVFGYGLMNIDIALDAVILKLYEQVLGKYWDVERRYIEENYTSVGFPFEELERQNFEIKTSWTFDELIGYLNTWSALQHYKAANDRNPLDLVMIELKEAWGNTVKREVTFPVFLKIGIKEN